MWPQDEDGSLCRKLYLKNGPGQVSTYSHLCEQELVITNSNTKKQLDFIYMKNRNKYRPKN